MFSLEAWLPQAFRMQHDGQMALCCTLKLCGT